MTEAKRVDELRAAFLADDPSIAFFKLDDRSTGGVPDCAVVRPRETLWLECKVVRTGERLISASVTPAQQLAQLLRVERASAGRCAWYVVWNEAEGRTEIWKPSRLLAAKNGSPKGVPIMTAVGYDYAAVVEHFRKGPRDHGQKARDGNRPAQGPAAADRVPHDRRRLGEADREG